MNEELQIRCSWSWGARGWLGGRVTRLRVLDLSAWRVACDPLAVFVNLSFDSIIVRHS